MSRRAERLPWRASDKLLTSARDYRRHRARTGPVALVLRKVARLRHIFYSICTSSDIDPNAELGEGLKLPHPNGIVVHAEARIGRDCMIMQQVTIGQRSTKGAPTIGDRVYIGAGAKVLGQISIGDGAAIGANAVVLHDVAPGCTAVGIPARVIANSMGIDPCEVEALSCVSTDKASPQ